MKYQKIAVSGVLVHQDKVLIVRRSANETFLAGKYEVPGGKVDHGEHPHDALVREFQEEVNLKINVKHFIRLFSYTSEEGNRHTVDMAYLVELDDDPSNIKLSVAHDDYKWISKEEIKEFHLGEEMEQNIIGGLVS